MLWLLAGLMSFPGHASGEEEALEEAIALIQEHLAGQATEAELYRAALEGITTYLNQKTGVSTHAVLTEEERDWIASWLRGEREGIGAVYHIIPGQGVLLEEVFPQGGAANAGLRAGDLIVAIDDHPFTGLSMTTIYELASQASLRAVVEMDVVRSDGGLHRFEVQRGSYQLVPVKQDDTNPACIELFFFSEHSAAQLEALLGTLPAGTGLLLDLRDNQGGLFKEALAAASLFLDPGAVITHRRLPNGTDESLVATGGRRWSGQVVILINERTAGMAEVFASALQEHKVATLVGAPTAGQASESGYYALGSGLVLQLADTSLRTPTGRSWAGTGLMPDVRVDPLQQHLSPASSGATTDIQRDTGLRLIGAP